MLNIKDIEKRLKENPEPDEVKEIRENITNTFSNLEFIEDGHKYYLHKPDGNKKEMTSVTTICHKKFEPYVDWDVILERKALNLGIAPEDLKREWKEKNITSTSNGTLTHLFAEGYMHFFMGNVDLIPEPIKKMQYEDGFLIPYGNKQKAVAKYYEDMFRTNGLYPVMPEAQIYIDAENNPYGIKYDISGTFDALFAFKDNNGKWKLSVRDWKTNHSLENSFNQKNGNTLLPPFDTLEFIDEPKSMYVLQLSLYQLGLEQLGYKVVDRKLLWLTEDCEYHKIDVRDVTKELIQGFSI
jgi:hypothetical protein